MKKIHIAMAVLAAAVFSSCTQEADHNEYVPKENGIAFYLQSTSTRSAETAPQVNTIELDGIDNFVLEESVTSLDEDWFYAPETKGTPAYTENVADLYKSFMGIAYKNETTTVALADAEFTANNGKWEHLYDILDPLANGDLRFYMRMPADVIDAQCENMDYKANGNIEFDYTSPNSATGQRDILFTSRPLSKSDYDPKQGAALLFHHALTGVKFRVQNDDDEISDMGIVITKVVFNGFQTSGHCTVVPDPETNYKDNKTNYSSATAVTWGTSELEGKTSIEISEEFGSMIDYSSSTTSLPGAFYEKDATHNINDAAASKTFWLIPQTLTTGKTITIYYEMNGLKDQYFVVNVDKIKSNVKWKAGEIRTYTFKLNDVNLKIEDTVTPAGTAADAFAGSTKSAVTITNTGNTNAFIRAAIVGQWLCSEDTDTNNAGDIVFGFTDAVGRLDLVESWYQDQFVNGTHNHGEFVGLAGYKDTATGDAANNSGLNPFHDWVLCSDGYYYYTKVVAPEGTTSKLFDSYKIKSAPQPTYGGQVWDVDQIYFTLEIATQAISANKLDGSQYAWDDAWAIALGEANKPVKK